MRNWISATFLSKFRAMSDWPSNFRQCIHCLAGYIAPMSREGSFRPGFGGGLRSSIATLFGPDNVEH